MAKQKASILSWTVNKAPKDIYQLKFRLENLPGVGNLEMVAGECLADSPVAAGKQLESILQNRIGMKKYKYLVEAKIVDGSGKDRAFLQINTKFNPVLNTVVNSPAWGTWLNVF